jgi:hypothetical protein
MSGFMQSRQVRQKQLRRRSILAAFSGLAFVVSLGCDGPEIKKYSAPREKAELDFTRLDSYRLPDDWTRQANPVELSVATFHAGSGDKPVVVTISRFPGKAGGLAANITRWRGKVGLPAVDDDQMVKELQWLKVDGEKAPYVDLANPNKTDVDRILGVVAERGPVTWFFKMQGPPNQVAQQKAAFEAFIESVKFGGTGANDG